MSWSLLAIDTGALVKTIWASLLAGIVITAAFSVALYGATRFYDLRRGARSVSALAYAGLSLLGLVVFIGAVVIGFIVMTSK